jgi:phenylalanyl-tRNA synthetase alpha chain
VAKHLRHSLESMVRNVFPAAERPLEIRWIETQFPFTSPSWEMEIYYRERWLEICGCGVIRQEILDRAGRPGKIGWAFGVGLERLAMVLHDIPDIRLFWSQDPRFLSQFDVAQNSDVDDDNNKPVKFRSFSKYPATYKDVSFWVPVQFHENIFCEMVREVCGDWVEDVQLIDKFTNRKTGRESRCYRIMYRAMDRTLLNEEVNQVQDKLLDKITTDLGVQIR